MSVVIDGTTGITTPGLTNTGSTTIVALTTTGNTTLGDATTDTLTVGVTGIVKDASGNVGVGVTPSAWSGSYRAFQFAARGVLANDSTDAGVISFGSNYYRDSGTNYVYLASSFATRYTQYAGQHQWYTATSGTAGNAFTFTQAMTLDASSNLGINTTSLNVAGLDKAVTLNGSTSSIYEANVSNGRAAYMYAASQGTVIGEYRAKTLQFTTSDTVRATIDSSGNLLVGTTTASYTASGRGNITLGGSSSALYALQVNGTPKGYLYQDGTDMYLVSATGRITITAQSSGVYLANGATSWTSNSDERKKDIIEPILNAATKVSTLRAVIGKYKTDNDGRRRSFLIAQDVQAVFPEAVEASNPDDLGVQYTEVIPLLVAAIKEQSVLITALTDRITALENK